MSRRKLAILAMCLSAAAACGVERPAESSGSVTVKLPPARPAVSAPGFGFGQAVPAATS